MSVYAIGDLHLSHDRPKPMAVFGPEWDSHPEKIRANWNRVVGDEDLVIVNGDISWAMQLVEAAADLAWLASLKGSKLLIRGNHDYWWSAIGKVRSALPAGMYAIQNDHFAWGCWAVCGTRGWLCPGEDGFDQADDEKIFLRELQRLDLSLRSAVREGFQSIIAALHFPPYTRQGLSSELTVLLEKAGVKHCVFGHIHDAGRETVFQGEKGGVVYHFTAADGVDFTPVLIVP
ncbi:MAG: metallophosphoesterase [Bacillota bacterium]